jgi:catechol 2,3-dioxygenase-like lactoylglutathione lyase family enzyme
MALHRLTTITVGVPDVDAATVFYRDFGLDDLGGGRFATTDGGEQLRLVPAERRGLQEVGLGADDPDDVDRVATSLAAIGVTASRTGSSLRAIDPTTGTAINVTVAPRLDVIRTPAPIVNAPGRTERTGARADAVLRDAPVRPRRLTHIVLGSPDADATHRFFTDGLGFKVSDRVPGVGAFLRCSTDHHNVLVQGAPVTFLHHTSWMVDDIDEVGRGGARMVAADPARHVWGLGRHHIGSNFFWYLRDPAGNFAEYASDLDVIIDDELWNAEDFADMRAIVSWGPPVPSSFIAPDDLGALMATGSG